jgi:hypothetical protein
LGWIEDHRHNRLKLGQPKYGSWTPDNFLRSRRNPIREAIDEKIDSINYLEMCKWTKKISWLDWFILDRLERVGIHWLRFRMRNDR